MLFDDRRAHIDGGMILILRLGVCCTFTYRCLVSRRVYGGEQKQATVVCLVLLLAVRPVYYS